MSTANRRNMMMMMMTLVY